MDCFLEAERLRARICALVEAETGAYRDYCLNLCDSISQNDAKRPCFASCFLRELVRVDFEDHDAARHWQGIFEAHRRLSDELGRPAGLHLALAEYFMRGEAGLKDPLFVESAEFRRAEAMAMLDGLTSVFNRHYMDLSLRKEFNRCERYRKELSIMILDIDDFKRLNDNHGHLYGDSVLRELAKHLKACVREEDAVCRYGGEEFLVILPETSASGAMRLAERIREGMKTSGFFREHGVCVSGGIATYPDMVKNAQELVALADKALYRAKTSGKDRILLSSPERRRHNRFPRPWVLDAERAMDGQGQRGAVGEVICHGVESANLSLGGIRFECRAHFDLDDSVILKMHESGSDTELCALGKVSWVNGLGGGLYDYGLSFLDPAPELLSRIGSYLSEESKIADSLLSSVS